MNPQTHINETRAVLGMAASRRIGFWGDLDEQTKSYLMGRGGVDRAVCDWDEFSEFEKASIGRAAHKLASRSVDIARGLGVMQ